jgi:hypothetical protein
MPTNKINLEVQMGQLPARGAAYTRQQFADDLASRLIVRFPAQGTVFGIGNTVPTSDEGPYFESIVTDSINGNPTQNSYQLLVWSSSLGAYEPIWLTQDQLRYAVSQTAPDPQKVLVWLKVNSAGQLENIATYNRTTLQWVEAFYTKAQVEAFFESINAGKGQVDWVNVLNKPNNLISAGATDLPGNALTPAFNYQRFWHVGIGGEIIYAVDKGQWVTVAGVTGDLKFVSGTSLGTVLDFNTGNFTTALGRNPGWVLATDEQGRFIAVADPSQVWNASTADRMDAGSLFGTREEVLDVTQIPAHQHGQVNLRVNTSANGGGTIANSGLMVGDVPGNNVDSPNTPGSSTNPTGDGLAHNNMPVAIARWLLRKA